MMACTILPPNVSAIWRDDLTALVHPLTVITIAHLCYNGAMTRAD